MASVSVDAHSQLQGYDMSSLVRSPISHRLTKTIALRGNIKNIIVTIISPFACNCYILKTKESNTYQVDEINCIFHASF